MAYKRNVVARACFNSDHDERHAHTYDLKHSVTATRAGGCCQVRAELGKGRCRFHGGKSTGPKTQAGRARIAEAQRRRWRAFRERLQANEAAGRTVDDVKDGQLDTAECGRPSPFITS
jgi:hypothetical protein